MKTLLGNNLFDSLINRRLNLVLCLLRIMWCLVFTIGSVEGWQKYSQRKI